MSWGFGRELKGLLYFSPVLLLSIKNEKLSQTGEMIFQPGCSTWSQFLSSISVALKPRGTFLWGSLVDLHRTVHYYKSKIQTAFWFILGCCLQESDIFFSVQKQSLKCESLQTLVYVCEKGVKVLGKSTFFKQVIRTHTLFFFSFNIQATIERLSLLGEFYVSFLKNVQKTFFSCNLGNVLFTQYKYSPEI